MNHLINIAHWQLIGSKLK